MPCHTVQMTLRQNCCIGLFASPKHIDWRTLSAVSFLLLSSLDNMPGWYLEKYDLLYLARLLSSLCVRSTTEILLLAKDAS